MALSNNLISQFVKMTNDKDKKDTKKETVVYGTMTKDENGNYNNVIIDGSSISTPVKKAVIAGENEKTGTGDRVIVTIKNHTAIVTSNLSNPTARAVDTTDKSTVNDIVANSLVANKIETDTIEAINGKIEKLQTNKLEADDLDAIEGEIDTLKTVTITAINGEIESLKSVDHDITGLLSAHNARIEYLEANGIETEKIDAAIAFIDSLEANEADINHMVSRLGEIDTIIFGVANGTVVQSSFSNNVVAHIGNAQIKSAMIDTISADQITAGSINSTEVTIASKDNRLQISDGTILITDGSNPRVQIGKDGKGDYSIVVCDKNGNVMFNTSGITEDAIKEAIIRNDMISTDANIDAKKLNIDSLFSVINGSSNTIKSSQVYLDTEGQSLNLAFKSITDTVTSQGLTIESQGKTIADQGKTITSQSETIASQGSTIASQGKTIADQGTAIATQESKISSQGTQISAIQGQISSKIWQQDIDIVKNSLDEQTEALATRYSEIEQNLTGFKAVVSDTYATNEKVDDISVGGQNLIVYKDLTPVYTNDTFSAKVNDGIITARDFKWYFNIVNLEGKLIPNQIYTISNEYIKDTMYGDYVVVRIYNHSTSHEYAAMYLYSGKSVTFTMPADIDVEHTSLYIYIASDESATFTISKLKLEKGNKVTDWSIAPEDIISNIDTAKTEAISTANGNTNSLLINYSTISDMNAAIDLKADSIKSEISSTYATKVDVNNLQIGGRNLVSYKDIKPTYPSDVISVDTHTGAINSDGMRYYFEVSNITGKLIPNQSYIISNESIVSEQFGDYVEVCIYDLTRNIQYLYTTLYSGSSRVFVVPDNIDVENASLLIYPSKGTLTSFTINKLKLEKGTRATDWTPAPEDVESQISANKTLIEQTATDLTVLIESSAKTATNYLNFSSSGLVIGDLTADTLGKNVLIDSDSVDIRNGATTLASFGADYLYLAKNSRDAKIDLCNSLAQMYHEVDDKGYSVFKIDTTYGLSYIKMSAPMSDLLILENTNNTNGVIIKGMINGTTVGGFGLLRDGNMVRYGGDADEDNPVKNIVLDTGNFLTEMDDGWHYTGGYGENFTQYNNEEYAKVRYRKIGGMVEIRGVMKPTTIITGSSTQHELFSLPEGYRPDSYMYQRCQADGVRSWLLTISPSGVVSFSRYGNGTSYIDAETTAWLPFQVTYFVN